MTEVFLESLANRAFRDLLVMMEDAEVKVSLVRLDLQVRKDLWGHLVMLANLANLDRKADADCLDRLDRKEKLVLLEMLDREVQRALKVHRVDQGLVLRVLKDLQASMDPRVKLVNLDLQDRQVMLVNRVTPENLDSQAFLDQRAPRGIGVNLVLVVGKAFPVLAVILAILDPLVLLANLAKLVIPEPALVSHKRVTKVIRVIEVPLDLWDVPDPLVNPVNVDPLDLRDFQDPKE